MSEQRNSGCVLNTILLAILAVLVFSVFGGALGLERMAERQVTIYPHIPVDPQTLNIQPSGAVFVPAPTPVVYAPVVVQAGSPAVVVPFVAQGCTVPEGWRVGVSTLPDCWDSLTREEQNAIIRSH